ncbi:MAG: hypothetical protein RIT43_2443, partial [Bacteroidota bacterium]
DARPNEDSSKGSSEATGSGSGAGIGTGFVLAGREMRFKPRVEDNSKEQGRVVIEILVDKDGVVVRADGPARGSTSSDTTLIRKCKDAALKTRFSPSVSGLDEQRGTITFNFILR